MGVIGFRNVLSFVNCQFAFCFVALTLSTITAFASVGEFPRETALCREVVLASAERMGMSGSGAEIDIGGNWPRRGWELRDAELYVLVRYWVDTVYPFEIGEGWQALNLHPDLVAKWNFNSSPVLIWWRDRATQRVEVSVQGPRSKEQIKQFALIVYEEAARLGLLDYEPGVIELDLEVSTDRELYVVPPPGEDTEVTITVGVADESEEGVSGASISGEVIFPDQATVTFEPSDFTDQGDGTYQTILALDSDALEGLYEVNVIAEIDGVKESAQTSFSVLPRPTLQIFVPADKVGISEGTGASSAELEVSVLLSDDEGFPVADTALTFRVEEDPPGIRTNFPAGPFQTNSQGWATAPLQIDVENFSRLPGELTIWVAADTPGQPAASVTVQVVSAKISIQLESPEDGLAVENEAVAIRGIVEAFDLGAIELSVTVDSPASDEDPRTGEFRVPESLRIDEEGRFEIPVQLLTPNKEYTLTVMARDDQGNSNQVSAEVFHQGKWDLLLEPIEAPQVIEPGETFEVRVQGSCLVSARQILRIRLHLYGDDFEDLLERTLEIVPREPTVRVDNPAEARPLNTWTPYDDYYSFFDLTEEFAGPDAETALTLKVDAELLAPLAGTEEPIVFVSPRANIIIVEGFDKAVECNFTELKLPVPDNWFHLTYIDIQQMRNGWIRPEWFHRYGPAQGKIRCANTSLVRDVQVSELQLFVDGPQIHVPLPTIQPTVTPGRRMSPAPVGENPYQWPGSFVDINYSLDEWTQVEWVPVGMYTIRGRISFRGLDDLNDEVSERFVFDHDHPQAAMFRVGDDFALWPAEVRSTSIGSDRIVGTLDPGETVRVNVANPSTGPNLYRKEGSLSLASESERQVILNWGERNADLDLQILDPEGRIIGRDYKAWKVWNTIAGSQYSGPTSKPEVVTFDGFKPGDYTIWIYNAGANSPVEWTLDVGAQAVTVNRELMVTKAGTGDGRVTSSPSGIDCGGDCLGSFEGYSQVTLTATPGAGSVFSGWSGACNGTGECTVTMARDRSVIARFENETSAECRTTIAPSTVNLPAEGGSIQVEVSSGAACPWQTASRANWITVSAGPSGVGNGTVELSVAPSSNCRSGLVLIGDQILSIVQGGGSSQSWESVGPGGGEVRDVLVADNGTILTATETGVARRGGALSAWVVDPSVGLPETLAFQPGNEVILYAGTGTATYKSMDGGTTWSEIPHYLGRVQAFAFDPSNPGIVFAASREGVFLSRDGGSSWEQLDYFSRNAFTVATDPASPGLVLVGDSAGIHRSTNGGQTWQQVSGAGDIYSFGISPQNSSTIYAGGSGVLLKSTNGGANWNSSAGGFGTPTINSFLIVHGSSEIVLAGGWDGDTNLFRSSNGGGSWQKVQLGWGEVKALAADPNDPASVYAATSNGLFYSANNGIDWTLIGDGPPTTQTVFIRTVDQNSDLLFTGGDEMGLMKSSDGGESWTRKIEGVKVYSFVSVSSSMLYTGVSDGVRKSTDAGETWINASSGLGERPVQTLASQGNTIYAGTRDGVFKSANAGGSWVQTGSTGLSETDVTVLAAPAAQLLYAATDGGGIFKSQDGGASWVAINSGLDGNRIRALVVDPRDSDRLFAATNRSVYRTSNGGSSWTEISTGLASKILYSLEIDPGDPDKLFGGDGSGRIYFSSDQGANWSVLNPPLPITQLQYGGTDILGLESLPGKGILYAATERFAVYAMEGSDRSCDFSVSPESESFTSVGGDGMLLVEASSGASWQAATRSDWIDVWEGAEGVGPGTVEYTVSPNTASVARIGNLVVAGENVSITQEANPLDCTFNLSDNLVSLSSSGGQGSVAVTTSANCAWKVRSNDSWIIITSSSISAGSGQVDFTVSENTLANARQGSMEVAGQALQVNQAGAGISNQPPTADAGPDQSVLAGQWVMLSGSGIDPEGGELSFAWEQINRGSESVELLDSKQRQSRFRAPLVQDEVILEFRLTVSDPVAAVDSDEVRVTVVPGSLEELLAPISLEGTERAGSAEPDPFAASFVGVAIANPKDLETEVLISGLSEDGSEARRLEPLTIAPRGQQAFVTGTDFPANLGAVSLTAHGVTTPIQGFFMVGNNNLFRLDGIGGQLPDGKSLYLPIVKEGGDSVTYLHLFCPQVDSQVRLKLHDRAGEVIAERNSSVAARGTLSGYIGDLLGLVQAISEGYLEILSQGGVLRGFEVIGEARASSALIARPAEISPQLLAPHFFIATNGESTLRLLNRSDSVVQVVLQAYGDQGQLIGQNEFEIPEAGLFVGTLSDLLGVDRSALGTFETIAGSLALQINAAPLIGVPVDPRVIGALTFSGNGGDYVSTLPLVGEGRKESLILHTAQSSELKIFTGLAILNPDSEQTAVVQVQAFDSAGALSATAELEIGPRSRVVDLLNGTLLFGGDFQQVGGHLQISSDRPVVPFALFGQFNLSYLSAIESQPGPGSE